ncbi:hypothetical protein [Wolbachia endosymbiont of Frankliniella intonsa]|uniref:hypothetical protein n=1 Tax=Wolbachia endosymbiont of Frankliniella intonsa TaxID=2902422 RepID=UPI00244E78AA|nr:hypothetical protein [Wolbachia endosymbiont of Frankliniella intonsa]WGJ62138.1 hypothetical protein M3L71_08125 [Wolbachia endosymbiont of Frankliniella intonsa]WGJ62180.1 hypothetical protein M3L71_00205 [Wolbachia endosymbiont of Frankliniella intonsa]
MRKKNPQSLYATSDKNTAKQYDEEAYDNKLKELRNLIIHSKNNFNHDIHVSLLIRVNNGIVGDIWDNPSELGKSSHEWKLIHCVKELLKINHGNFKQILGSIEDLMEPSLKQYKELSPPINITQDQNLKTTALAEVSLQSKESFPGDTENDLQGNQPTPGGCKPLKREGTEGLAVPSAGTKIDMNSGQLQTTSHELQNPYDNAGMYSALGVAVVGFIAIGVMLCATGNPVLGGVFIAVPVISALILGIAKIYEEVSKKKEKKPEIDTLTALREVLTPQWLSKGRVSNI